MVSFRIAICKVIITDYSIPFSALLSEEGLVCPEGRGVLSVADNHEHQQYNCEQYLFHVIMLIN